MVTDYLLHGDMITEFTSRRLPIKVHGSGCTLSSYIAGHLAKGCDIRHAVAGSKRRVQDAIAMSAKLGKGMAIVNPMATKQKEAMRYSHVESLRKAVGTMEARMPLSLLPESRTNFVYALPNPQDFHEVCGVEGGIQITEGRPIRKGDILFGTSDWLSRAIMNMNPEHPDLLAGLEIRHTKKIKRMLQDLNIALLVARPNNEGGWELAMEDGPCGPSEQLGLVPDALFDLEGMGKEPRFGIIGRDPEDILRKIGPCLDGVTR
jgi:hydroxymethylpyrimidine/phosphomethylpyrimidine kinase